jgi:hypothetical protein
VPEGCELPSDSRTSVHRVRVARFVAGQFGVVARRQLTALRVPSTTVARWVEEGYLYRRLPGVYAVGHVAPSVEANLCAALLWAGPGAMLSHACGAWWRGLVDRHPRIIELSTPRQLRSRREIRVHGRCDIEREWHRGLPVVPVPELLLQFARTAAGDELRRATAEADYRGWLDLDQMAALCGRGRPGSANLRAALARHLPQLAVTHSEFERRLLYLCERHAIPLPECDVRLFGFQIDALWREQKVIVELDGRDGHAPWGRIRRDHHRDLILRRAGFVTLRYVWEQLTEQGADVAADILAAISSAAPSAARGSR